ncbi:MAG TPA: tetratricopeptide repeat protein [Candidatus Krumholzibacterium sp.]|nr:tetratricopeptide repeat protein [Candidatus Krumholzibacterium sp.]
MSYSIGKTTTLLLLIMTALIFTTTPGCRKAAPIETTPEDEATTEPAPSVSEAETSGAIIFDATVAAQNGLFETARAMLESLLEREPDNLEALRLLARVYSAAGDAASSARTWGRVSELDPADPDAAYESGTALARKGLWQDLRTKMLGAEGYGTADARHFLLLGEASLELGYGQEAEKYLRKAGDIELATVLLGKLYYGRGNTALAEEAFRRTLEKNSMNYLANLHMGYISFSEGRKAAALKYYTKAHKADPSDPLACLSMASLYEKMGRSGEAVEYYRKALGLEKTPRVERKKVYVSLTKILLQENRLSETGTAAAEGIREFPAAGGILYYWGEALLRQGDSAGAKEKFKKAAEDPAWKKHALERFHSIR